MLSPHHILKQFHEKGFIIISKKQMKKYVTESLTTLPKVWGLVPDVNLTSIFVFTKGICTHLFWLSLLYDSHIIE